MIERIVFGSAVRGPVAPAGFSLFGSLRVALDVTSESLSEILLEFLSAVA